MTILGEQRTESEQGSFFLPEGGPDQLWFHFSKRFLDQNEEHFLGEEEKSAAVLQFSYDMFGEVVSHDDDRATTKPKTLQFLAAEDGTYYWQLTEAHEEGHDQFVIGISKNNLVGELTMYDRQGRESNKKRLEIDHTLAVLGTIRSVTESDEYNSRTEDFIHRKQQALEGIIEFEKEGKHKYTPEKLQRLLDEKREVFAHIGFTSLGIKPIETTQ